MTPSCLLVRFLCARIKLADRISARGIRDWQILASSAAAVVRLGGRHAERGAKNPQIAEGERQVGTATDECSPPPSSLRPLPRPRRSPAFAPTFCRAI